MPVILALIGFAALAAAVLGSGDGKRQPESDAGKQRRAPNAPEPRAERNAPERPAGWRTASERKPRRDPEPEPEPTPEPEAEPEAPANGN